MRSTRKLDWASPDGLCNLAPARAPSISRATCLPSARACCARCGFLLRDCCLLGSGCARSQSLLHCTSLCSCASSRNCCPACTGLCRCLLWLCHPWCRPLCLRSTRYLGCSRLGRGADDNDLRDCCTCGMPAQGRCPVSRLEQHHGGSACGGCTNCRCAACALAWLLHKHDRAWGLFRWGASRRNSRHCGCEGRDIGLRQRRCL